MFEIVTIWHDRSRGDIDRFPLPDGVDIAQAMDIAKRKARSISQHIKKSNESYLARTTRGGTVIACVAVERIAGDADSELSDI